MPRTGRGLGLRESKKQRAREAIIENAIALFRERGFEATTVREIVARCDLSEATFFNYFGSKDSLLGEWAHGVVGSELASGDDEAHRGLRPALRAACGRLARVIEDDRAFAARAWSRAHMPTAAPPLLLVWIEDAQRAEAVRRDLSPRQMGEILYTGICGTVASWLAREAPAGSLGAELRRAVDLLVDGGRRRNERVRPSGPAATTGAGTGAATGARATSPVSTR